MITAELGEVIIWIIIVTGILTGIGNVIYLKMNPNCEWNWIKINYMLMGFYWAGIYLAIKFFPGLFETSPSPFSRTYIRPAIAWLCLVLALSSLIRVTKSLYLPDLIRKLIADIKKRRERKDGMV